MWKTMPVSVNISKRMFRLCLHALKWSFSTLESIEETFLAAMRIHAWGAMCFALFFQWFSPRTSGCVVHCDNQFHRWARVAVWLLESKNLYFFGERKTNLASRIKKLRFFDERRQICLSEPEKIKVFWWEKTNCNPCKSMKLIITVNYSTVDVSGSKPLKKQSKTHQAANACILNCR